MKRRTAIKNTVLGLGALSLGACKSTNTLAKNKKMNTNTKYGVQLFTIPNMVDEDFRGTLELISDIGYREVEFFGPYPFSAKSTIEQWENVFKPMLGFKNSAFYGYSVQETADLLKSLNLTAPSMHADMLSMQENMTELLDNLAVLDAKYVVLPALFEGRSNLDDYKKLAETFNGFGAEMAKYGMSFVYHNHGYEHQEMSGHTPLDFLIQNTNADNVKFELDIFWMSAAGADPVEYLEKYPNRFKLLHLKDSVEKFTFKGDGGTPEQWMEVMPKMRDLGDGVFDISAIMAVAEKSGVQHFLLERDRTPTPETTLRNSFDFLAKI